MASIENIGRGGQIRTDDQQGGASGLHPTQAELEWGTRWSEAGQRGGVSDLHPTQAELGWGTRASEAGPRGGASGLHPTQAELGWGTRASEAGRRAVRATYIPPKQSLDGSPERLRLVSGAVRVADPTSQKRDMGTRAVR